MTSAPEPVEQLLAAIPQQRVSDRVAEQIAALIGAGKLQPGDRLPTEHELARSLSVGRTSIREGLQKLQTLGLIRVERGRGAFVRAHDQVEAHQTFARWSAERRFAIEELLETRMAVEATAAALAATRAGDDDLAELELRHADVVAAAAGPELPRLVVADAAFHDAVMRAGKNELLRKVYALLVDEITEFRAKTLSLDGAAARATADHAAILAAIGRRDPDAARRAMINHLWVLYEEVREAAASQRSADSPLAGAPRGAFE